MGLVCYPVAVNLLGKCGKQYVELVELRCPLPYLVNTWQGKQKLKPYRPKKPKIPHLLVVLKKSLHLIEVLICLGDYNKSIASKSLGRFSNFI